MIERLMDQERPYGEPRYSKISAQMEELQQKLRVQLPPEGQDLLNQLADASIHRECALVEDVFMEGFCTAVTLALEVYKHID